MSFELNLTNPTRAFVSAEPLRPGIAAAGASEAGASGAGASGAGASRVASKFSGRRQPPSHGQPPPHGQPPSQEPPPRHRQQPKGEPPCAFIVDDDPDVWRALARHLSPELHVHVAATVAQAEVLLGQLERLDVAFVALELPDGSGEQILEQLARWPDAIRVLISGTGGCDEDALKNRTLANIVLRKPVLPRVIEALKRAALALPND